METICKGKGCQNLSSISAGVSHPPRLLVTQWICDVANAHSIGMNVKYENYIWRQFAGGKMLASFCRERRLPESEQYQHRYISSPSLCLLVTRWICSILLISSEWMWIFYKKNSRDNFKSPLAICRGKGCQKPPIWARAVSAHPPLLSARDQMNLSDAPHTGDTTNLVCLVSKCFGLQKWINSLGTGGYQG